MKKYEWLIFLTVVLSIISLFLEQIDISNNIVYIFRNSMDFVLMFIILLEIVYELISSKYRKMYISNNMFSLIFTIIFFSLFIYSKFFSSAIVNADFAIFAILLKNVFMILKVYSRMKKLSKYMEKFTANPAQSILLSFVFIILVGTFLLMMKFTTLDNKGLSFLDALFTATSATCVTGLIVVDTATVYTIWGQLVIIVLIQIGGLGIMLLSFFTVFLLGKRLSIQDTMILSYMLSEDDTTGLQSTVVGIVVTTFVIEGLGVILLFLGFLPTLGFSVKNLYYSVFHSISAFCNAGFALYSNSLESFRLNPIITLTISLLIILGGIGFSVIYNVRAVLRQRLYKKFFKKSGMRQYELTLNSKIVLSLTTVLLIIGTLLFYILEYNHSMSNYNLGEQYLAAFFQSVTLRTAGFNSIPFSAFRVPTYLFMCVFMFIGAASGGTAGGVKIGTIRVLYATIKAYFHSEDKICMGRFQISNQQARSAFVICFSGLIVAFMALFVLSITESTNLLTVAVEIFSAIGTVGVTAGITGILSGTGKIIIILLMFWGRLGAITIMSATAFRTESVNINWPQAEIFIG